MRTLNYKKDADKIEALYLRRRVENTSVTDVVSAILSDVKARGDEALYSYTRKFDGFELNEKNILVTEKELNDAVKRVDKKTIQALKHAQRNITLFHRKQYQTIKKSWKTKVEEGVVVGERITPISSVGCYVPGGRAAYPSTVLMNCIPAKVSGVERIVVVSPPPIKDVVLAAARVCGVDEVYRVGGAQAVAALAYGTKSIKRVSKIVGPGNKYVTTAKMLVYGTVDVDMPAGPSEIVIIADETANPEYITADLLAQGEHDPDAVCILVTDDSSLPEKIKVDGDQFTAVIVHSTKDAINFVNRFSPEHLEVLTEKAESVCSKVKNAGAVFIGKYSPVAAGDYASGGNHVLPTDGSAAFSSPLSVRDFLKTTIIQRINATGLGRLRGTVGTLAESEGLPKHRKSINVRFKNYF